MVNNQNEHSTVISSYDQAIGDFNRPYLALAEIEGAKLHAKAEIQPL